MHVSLSPCTYVIANLHGPMCVYMHHVLLAEDFFAHLNTRVLQMKKIFSQQYMYHVHTWTRVFSSGPRVYTCIHVMLAEDFFAHQ